MSKYFFSPSVPLQESKGLARWLTVGMLMLLFLGLSVQIASANPVQIGNATVEFIAVEYNNPQAGESTWFYKVISGGGGGVNAVSHVTFGICAEAGVLGAGIWDGPDNFDNRTSGAGLPESIIQQDPQTGVVGLKFDEGFDNNETRYYYFTLDQNYMVSDVQVGVKAGASNLTGILPGPTCDPTAVSLHSLLTTTPHSQTPMLLIIAALMAVMVGFSYLTFIRQYALRRAN